MCNTNLSYTNTFSIRVTAVIRTAIAEEYKREKIREKSEYHENI